MLKIMLKTRKCRNQTCIQIVMNMCIIYDYYTCIILEQYCTIIIVLQIVCCEYMYNKRCLCYEVVVRVLLKD